MTLSPCLSTRRTPDAARIYVLPPPPALCAARRAARERAEALRRVTAVVAHEIANPLNFVVNFAELSADLAAGVLDAVGDALPGGVPADLADDLALLADNLARILAHGRRAAGVVRSMADARDDERRPSSLPAPLRLAVTEVEDRGQDGGGRPTSGSSRKKVSGRVDARRARSSSL